MTKEVVQLWLIFEKQWQINLKMTIHISRIVNGIKLYSLTKNTQKKILKRIHFPWMIVELKLGHTVNKVIILEIELHVLVKLEVVLGINLSNKR